jgi:hypothetical protein
MSLIYGGYVWLFHYRMNMSEVWQSKSIITPEDSAIIAQLGMWSEVIEVSFLLLFVGMVVFCFLKRQSERLIMRNFFGANAILALGIVVFSLVFNPFTSLTFMDLVLPLINLLGIIILLTIYLLLKWL